MCGDEAGGVGGGEDGGVGGDEDGGEGGGEGDGLGGGEGGGKLEKLEEAGSEQDQPEHRGIAKTSRHTGSRANEAFDFIA